MAIMSDPVASGISAHERQAKPAAAPCGKRGNSDNGIAALSFQPQWARTLAQRMPDSRRSLLRNATKPNADRFLCINAGIYKRNASQCTVTRYSRHDKTYGWRLYDNRSLAISALVKPTAKSQHP